MSDTDRALRDALVQLDELANSWDRDAAITERGKDTLLPNMAGERTARSIDVQCSAYRTAAAEVRAVVRAALARLGDAPLEPRELTDEQIDTFMVTLCDSIAARVGEPPIIGYTPDEVRAALRAASRVGAPGAPAYQTATHEWWYDGARVAASAEPSVLGAPSEAAAASAKLYEGLGDLLNSYCASCRKGPSRGEACEAHRWIFECLLSVDAGLAASAEPRAPADASIAYDGYKGNLTPLSNIAAMAVDLGDPQASTNIKRRGAASADDRALRHVIRAVQMFGAARLERSEKGVEWRVMDPDEWEAAWEELAKARAALARAEGEPQPVGRESNDIVLGLRLARHLWAIQGEDGCDYIGQETNDLAFAVMRHFGLRFKLVEHAPVPACKKVEPHLVSECEHDGIPTELEPDPAATPVGPPIGWLGVRERLVFAAALRETDLQRLALGISQCVEDLDAIFSIKAAPAPDASPKA